MVLAGIGVRFGTTTFTAQEAQYFTASVKRGMSRSATRDLFRESFGRGFGNAAFAEARATLTAAERAGINLSRLKPTARLTATRIPQVSIVNPSHRYVTTARVTARVPAANTTVSRIVRFGSDEPPTMQQITARSQDILDKGVKQAQSSMQVASFEGLSIFEQLSV